MILVLCGTADGREIAAALAGEGYSVLASAATVYGGQLLDGCGGEVITGRLTAEEMLDLIRQRKVRLLVDATHPYAEMASAVAAKACRLAGVPYIRYQRPAAPLPRHPLIQKAGGYEAAAALAARTGETIFLTTGSKTLPVFIKAARELGRRVVARVLPEPAIIENCRRMGLTPADIIALQGPCSEELNRALLAQYKASVLVTKESGDPGGTTAKIAAALSLALPVVIVERPTAPPDAVDTLSGLLQQINVIKNAR